MINPFHLFKESPGSKEKADLARILFHSSIERDIAKRNFEDAISLLNDLPFDKRVLDLSISCTQQLKKAKELEAKARQAYQTLCQGIKK